MIPEESTSAQLQGMIYELKSIEKVKCISFDFSEKDDFDTKITVNQLIIPVNLVLANFVTCNACCQQYTGIKYSRNHEFLVEALYQFNHHKKIAK